MALSKFRTIQATFRNSKLEKLEWVVVLGENRKKIIIVDIDD